jgi:DNA topoisomerase-2
MSKKPNYKLLTVDDYSDLDPREHVYVQSGMYIGSDTNLTRDDWLLDLDTMKMKYREIEFVPGCERIYVEIISNAADHCNKSLREGCPIGPIEVTMTKKTITIKNYGLPIPIELKPGKNMYIPEYIFGNLRTSTHYEEETKRDIGTNGIGSKVANIFSTRFEVVVENAVMKKRYVQVWEDNMKVCNKPTITKFDGTESSVQISYDLEFKRFGLKEYPHEAFELFARHAADISFTGKLTIKFNDKQFNYSDIKEYARLYYGDLVEKSVVHYQYPNKKSKTPDLELIVLDTPDEGTHVSFVNCILTKNGGVHLNAAYKAVCDPIINMVNENIMKKLAKSGYDQREKKSHTINIGDVRPHISILLSCKVADPDFDSQSKNYLNKPAPKVDIKNETLQPVFNWSLVKRLYMTLDAKQMSNLAKTDGKMGWHVDIQIDGFRDAADAGEKGKSLDCILCLTEGKSGAGYVNKYITTFENGSTKYGVLPLRGKCLNTTNADKKQIEKNKEIVALKKALALKEGVDYTIAENFNQLRYGSIMICTDSDVDGKHITGLIINILYGRFPSLLKVPGFLVYKRTPIIRMTKGKKVIKFYTQREFDVWYTKQINTATEKGWTPKYFKGLGTSTMEDVRDDKKDEKIVTFVWDDEAEETINLAFKSERRNDRKKWIMEWSERHDVDTMLQMPISLFIHYEMIKFSQLDNTRSIPKMMDGFKESHRKIMAGCHHAFHIGPLDKKYEEYNVCDLDSYCKKKMVYHHGNDILSHVIIGMARDYVGSNNVNLFEPRGSFGSRLENGDDAAAPRYLHTFPTSILPFIYVQDDQDLLIPMIDEGKEIEPKYFLPIIPNILVNGSKGIGTGFSTYIPCHNPVDIINWLKSRLTGSVSLPTLTPWYRGFTGNITIIDRRKKKDKFDDKINADVDLDNELIEEGFEDILEEEVDPEDLYVDESKLKNRPLMSFVTTGTYTMVKNNIIITELPIGMSPDRYRKKILDKFLEQKKIKKYIDNCDVDVIKFTIKGFRDNPSYQSLGIRKRYSMSNMVLLNKNDKPIKYNTANDIIETFYNDRLPYYELRKKHKLNKFKLEIEKLDHLVNFTNAIVSKKLIIQNVPKTMIYEKMDELCIPHAIYDKANISILNKEEVSGLNNKIDNLNKESQKLSKISPSELWLNDLKLFENKYKQIYK